MKLTVIGAGAIGSAVAQDLLAHETVTQVQVCDARARALKALHAEVESPRLRSFQVEARDPVALGTILDGSACVIGAAQPEMNPALAALCLERGLHYCDLGGPDEIVAEELALAEQAQERGVWIIPNCGLDPGLSHMLCAHGVRQFDTVEALHLRVGDVPLHPEPPFNFRIAWSAEKLLDDYTRPATFIEAGTVQETEPLTREEVIHFPEPFGAMEAFCIAGGTLIDDLAGHVDTFEHKLIRWPGHAAQMRFLLALGFAENRHIDVRTHLTYRDVLLRRMRQRLGGAYHDAVLLRVLIHGQKDGAARTLVFEMIEPYDEAADMTAIRRCTSIPTAAVALLLAEGQVPGGGAAPPEAALPTDAFLDRVAARGLTISETWHDGARSVAGPAAPEAQAP